MAIELLKDANGQIIPLDTKVLYDADGDQCEVSRFDYWVSRDCDRWDVVFATGYNRYASEMYLDPPAPPDSLEKLAADIDRTLNHLDGLVCAYANRKKRECNGCKLSGHLSCLKAFTSDISSRVHRLAGE